MFAPDSLSFGLHSRFPTHLVLFDWKDGGTTIAKLDRDGRLFGCRDVSPGPDHDGIVGTWIETETGAGKLALDDRRDRRAPFVAGQVLTYPDITAAACAGFATFNEGPHLAVDVPDGNFTITARTSNSKLLTVCFVPYQQTAAAGCVDIWLANSALPTLPDRPELRPFHAVGFGPGRGDPFDTRKIPRPMTLLTVLLDDSDYQPKG